jgi:hypothetical protein
MNLAECNYDIENKKLLAIVEAIKHWHQYLKGAIHDFTIFTDHKNLVKFMEAKVLNRRQARWIQFLANFHFQTIYRLGHTMGKLNALMRRQSE